ncbi:hypothetical protein AX27061_2625 [Achromobacter xylosoxidans NBRC 15126 = ATCC 27061]|nr:hypothetical protein AX27061_2625 [Achromobacter xylosoxidans NBRC 15126 = ATCC 27061]
MRSGRHGRLGGTWRNGPGFTRMIAQQDCGRLNAVQPAALARESGPPPGLDVGPHIRPVASGSEYQASMPREDR